MVCDEVMAGFGRSGKIFSFCHAPTVIPDIVTFAKGVNGGYVSLGGLGIRDHLAEHFRKNPVGYGSTYNGHPVGLASAYAAVQVMLEDDVLGNVQRMEPIMAECMAKMAANHPCVKQGRNTGLFGCFDLQKNTRGDFVSVDMSKPNQYLGTLKKALWDANLFTMMRGHNVFTNPPLIIGEEDLRKGFDIIDKALYEVDAIMED